MFQSSVYQERRTRLMREAPEGLILLLGNEESPMNYAGNPYPFRQDSSFAYYVGLDQPGMAAVLDPEFQRVILFGEEATTDQIVWMGPIESLKNRAARSGIEEVQPPTELGPTLQRALDQRRTVHYLPPYRADNQIKVHQMLGIPLKQVVDQASESLIRAVVAQRSVKTEAEIREMERAVNITAAMHLAAMEGARPGILEADLLGIVEGVALAGEGYPAYPVILTVNGQFLHNHAHHNTLRSGQLVLGDFGAATSGHYAADITRTFTVDPSFSPRQREIYQIVLDAQQAALSACRPGIAFRDVHLRAAEVITGGLQQLGLMKGDVQESVKQGAHALFFPHGLGHMIGLDVHDMEDLGEQHVGYGEEFNRSPQFGLKALRLARTLQPGFTLTVEPGVYFIPQLIEQWRSERHLEQFIRYDKLESYLDFGGIRIEDNILITNDGHRLLGAPIPKGLEEVETVRRR